MIGTFEQSKEVLNLDGSNLQMKLRKAVAERIRRALNIRQAGLQNGPGKRRHAEKK
jgi:hypothetical protein